MERHVDTESKINGTNLSAMYSFDNFVPCDGNMVAYLAAKAIISEERRYNPFCLVGKSGNGKTHLIQAIGNAIVEKEPDRKVLYDTTEGFVNEAIHAIRNSQMYEFREKYRAVDVLLLDDIHFIEGKQASEGELEHIIDFLYRKEKQIVFTVDKAPKKMNKLNRHILNLVKSGLVVKMTTPDPAMRASIVRAKAKEKGILLRDEVIDYISDKCHSSISEIEGAINSIAAYTELARSVITLDTAKVVLKDFVSGEDKMS